MRIMVRITTRRSLPILDDLRRELVDHLHDLREGRNIYNIIINTRV